jgi:hypothetical protein
MTSPLTIRGTRTSIASPDTCTSQAIPDKAVVRVMSWDILFEDGPYSFPVQSAPASFHAPENENMTAESGKDLDNQSYGTSPDIAF